MFAIKSHETAEARHETTGELCSVFYYFCLIMDATLLLQC